MLNQSLHPRPHATSSAFEGIASNVDDISTVCHSAAQLSYPLHQLLHFVKVVILSKAVGTAGSGYSGISAPIMRIDLEPSVNPRPAY
jgi:hypothetical protein